MRTVTWQMVVNAAAESIGASKAEIMAAIKQPLHPAGLRDEFAIAALTGMLAAPAEYQCTCADEFADAAYRYADAMMEARKPPAPVESIAGYEATAGAVRHVLAGAGLRGNLDDAVRDVVQSLIDKGLV